MNQDTDESLPAAARGPAPCDDPYLPCDGRGVICKTLRKRLGDGYSKGLNSMMIVNFGTGEEQPPLLVYKASAKDRGVSLNFCPFCGIALNLDYINRDGGSPVTQGERLRDAAGKDSGI